MSRDVVTWSYRIAGLTVASEYSLHPNLVPLPSGNQHIKPDVVIRQGIVPEALDAPIFMTPFVQIAADRRVLISIKEIGRFLIRDGQSVTVAAHPGDNEVETRYGLLGLVLAGIMMQRDRVVFHASLVGVGDGVVGFMGQSGAGKSTVAGILSTLGYEVLSDDLAFLSESPGDQKHGGEQSAPRVFPGQNRLKLWADTVELLGLDKEAHEQTRAGQFRFGVHTGTPIRNRAVRLKALYMLSARSDETQPIIIPLEGGDAVAVLHGALYRWRWLFPMNRAADSLRAAADIAATTPVLVVNKPRDLEDMPEVVSTLEKAWESGGWS